MDAFRIAFGRPMPDLWIVSDEEFLQSIDWSRSASSALAEAAASGDASATYRALVKHGLGRQAPKGHKKASSRLRHKRTLWSRLAFDDSRDENSLIDFWKKFQPNQKRNGERSGKKRKQGSAKSKKSNAAKPEGISRLAGWLEQASGQEQVSPIELLVLFELLQQAGTYLPAELGWRVWRVALVACLEMQEEYDLESSGNLTDDQRLLIFGELPIAAASVFGCIKKSGKLFRVGAEYLKHQLEEMTDTDGTPNARLLPRISLWLATIVRATEWARRSGETLWEDDEEDRFGLLMQRAAAICRTDGHLALCNGRSRNVASLLADASRLAGWKKKSLPSRYVLAVENGAARSRGAARFKIVADDDHPATQSDWAKLACLRNNWSATPDTLVVAHHCDKPLIDLTALGSPLISGAWDLRVVVDGAPVALKNDWECTCWFSDDDADFMELHVLLDRDVKIERQLLLSREEHFAVFSDVVVAPAGSHIDYLSRLPLVDDVSVHSDTMSRECTVKAGKVRARFFPLALPDERVRSAAGRFGHNGAFLELEQQAEGALLAPVFIDWDPGRRHSYADWKTLTVSEEGRALKRSDASAHRIRVGDYQLVVYRSLRASGELRAVLGHHTPHETVIGVFADDGEVDPLLLVES